MFKLMCGSLHSQMDRYDHVIWGSFQDGAFVGFTDPLPLYSLLLEDI